jgi:hypothetical protein
MKVKAVLAAALAMPVAAVAQQGPPLPDPASIAVPDIASADPSVQAEGYKFFIFHNPAVSFAEAHADIAECRAFLPSGEFRPLPSFVPWGETAVRASTAGPGPYGLVGDAIGAVLVPKIVRGQRNNKLRRCMEPRGYLRYAVPEAAWDRLNEGDEAALVLMQAKLASGPRPAAPEVRE